MYVAPPIGSPERRYFVLSYPNYSFGVYVDIANDIDRLQPESPLSGMFVMAPDFVPTKCPDFEWLGFKKSDVYRKRTATP
jgi:hypothetical protein